MAPVRLDECLPFVALSYVWEDPSVESEIITVNSHPKRIGANLAAALRFFRKTHQPSALAAEASPELPRHIWVDALCINQEDNSEKYVQVGHMESIYKSASIVSAHLETEAPSHTKATTLLERLVKRGTASLPNVIERRPGTSITFLVPDPCFSTSPRHGRRWRNSLRT